jgi:inhibitor of cysteine peptidase
MRPRPVSRLFLPVVLAAAVAGGCGGADVTVDETADGGSVDLEVGQTLEVSLEENPSTGYAWNVTEAPDAAVIAPVEDDFAISDPYSDGAGGTRTLLFEAVAPGETEMLLDYYFQTDSDDVSETFSLTVTVAP